MVKNSGSRFVFGLMVIPCVILCFISVISFSTFAAVHAKIRDKKDGGGDYCILFSKHTGQVTHKGKTYESMDLGGDGPCVFSIWGQVAVCFVSIVLGTLYTVKALLGVNVLSCFTSFETILIILTGLLDFVVAIVITAGLDMTCGSSGTSQASCEHATLYLNNFEDKVEYYSDVNASKATAWIGTLILAILGLLHLIMMCVYFRQLSKRGDPTPYEPMNINEDSTAEEIPAKV